MENMEDDYYPFGMSDHTKTQEDDYYPFGMRHTKRYTDTPENRHLFNSGSEFNAKLGVYETPFRQYDPVLGRFNGIDAMASNFNSMSPYQFGSNSPAMANDPTGLYPSWYTPGMEAEFAQAANERAAYYLPGGGGSDSMADLAADFWDGWGDSHGQDYEKTTKEERKSARADRRNERQSAREKKNDERKARREKRRNEKTAARDGDEVKTGDLYASANEMIYPDTDNDPKPVYSGVHTKDLDILWQNESYQTEKGYIEITRTILIKYPKAEKKWWQIFGTKTHEIIQYGYKVKEYVTGEVYYPDAIDPVYGEIDNISKEFWDEIYMTVNSHLKCNCYKDMVPPPNFDAGSPHR